MRHALAPLPYGQGRDEWSRTSKRLRGEPAAVAVARRQGGTCASTPGLIGEDLLRMVNLNRSTSSVWA